MKKHDLFVVLLLLISNGIHAQLKVESTGNIKINKSHTRCCLSPE